MAFCFSRRKKSLLLSVGAGRDGRGGAQAGTFLRMKQKSGGGWGGAGAGPKCQDAGVLRPPGDASVLAQTPAKVRTEPPGSFVAGGPCKLPVAGFVCLLFGLVLKIVLVCL